MRLALLTVLSVLLAPAVLGQARRDTLPPLAPRDLEIRGELRVSLPSIERQPLTAFGLAPRLKTVDPRRVPAMPAYATPAIPGSALGAPVLPELVSLDPGVPRRGTFEAGLGRSYARFAHAYFSRAASPATALFADAAYDGLSGFRPEGRPNTGADAGRLALGVRHARGTTALGATLDADVVAQGLYGAGPFSRRGGASGGLQLDASGYAPVVTGLRLGGSVRASGGRFDPEDYQSREAHLDAALSLARESGPAAGWLDGAVRVGRLDDGIETGQFTLSAGTGVTLQRGEASLRVGPRFLLADEARRRSAFTLDLDGRLGVAPGVSLLLTNTPRVSGGRFADVFAESPFSAPQPDVRSEVVPVDARAGASFTQGTTEATGWVGYRRHTQGRFYEQPLGAGLVQTGYAALGEMAAGVTVRAMQLAGLHALAGVELRDPVFTAKGLDSLTVPYRAPVEASLQVGVRLPGGRGLVQATLRGEGVRYADRARTMRVAPSSDLDLFVSYAVTPFVHLIGRLDNVRAGGDERWKGFPEARLLAQAGLSFRW
jgi:hypothetical protein